MVDNVVGDNIAAMGQNHYEKLLNSNKDTSYKSNVLETIKGLPKQCDVKVDILDVHEATCQVINFWKAKFFFTGCKFP